MAKRGTLEHPKTLALADALGIMDCFALGILEAFWHHVGKYHEDGDVTDLKPGILCRSIRYSGDATALWDALLSAGFLTQVDGRTIVHGWSEHADDAIHSRMYRAVRRFADGNKPLPRSIGKEERARLDVLWEQAETVADIPKRPRTSIESGSKDVPDSCRTVDGQLPDVLPEPEPEPIPEPEDKYVEEEGCGEKPKLAIVHVGSPPVSESLWWLDDPGSWEAELCETVRASKGYGEVELPEEQVRKLVASVKGFCPDREAFSSVLEAFAEDAQKHRKPKYSSPVKALRNWFEMREARWREILKSRGNVSRPTRPSTLGSAQTLIDRLGDQVAL